MASVVKAGNPRHLARHASFLSEAWY